MKKKLNKYIFALFLVLSWLVITFVYLYSRSNLTVIPLDLPDSALTQKTFTQLLKGQEIKGQFNSKENYLGQVLVRFYNYDRINKDSVNFRLREKGDIAWYYEHTYKTDQFLPNGLFTFGFPPIIESKGKIYEFEIESVKGKPEDAITLSEKRPLSAVLYQYPKSVLVKNPAKLVEFLEGKITNFKLDRDFLINLITYLDFIAIFLFLEYFALTSLKRSVFSIKNIESSYLIALSIIGLVFSAMLLYLKMQGISETVTIISYFMLVVGIAWLLIEHKSQNK